MKSRAAGGGSGPATPYSVVGAVLVGVASIVIGGGAIALGRHLCASRTAAAKSIGWEDLADGNRRMPVDGGWIYVIDTRPVFVPTKS